MASIAKFCCLNVIFVMYCGLTAAEKVMRTNFKEIKQWSDDKHISHKITFDAADPHLNLTINVLKDLQDVDMQTEIRVVQKNDPTYFLMLNNTHNLCNFLEWRNQSPVGSILYSYLTMYGHIVEKCPIAKGEYYMYKFWFPEDKTMALLPEFDFEIKIFAYLLDSNRKRELIMSDHIKGEGTVQDVSNVKPGILAMLPKAA